MSIEDVLKLVEKKYPTCSLVDARPENQEYRTIYCKEAIKTVVVGQTKKRPGWDVELCTGNFKVYVLAVTPRSENAE